MYKQVRKQKVTRLGILMKNSNNIKWGVSTADTLLLRALQTDRVTRHTHYTATIQPLSVMMMAALTEAQLLNQLSCSGGRGLYVVVESRHAISWRFTCRRMSRATWILHNSSFGVWWPLHRESHFWNTQIKIWVLKDSNCPPAQQQEQ